MRALLVAGLALHAAAAPRALSSQGGHEAAPGAEPFFIEAAAEVGLDFVHFNGMSGEYYMAEINGAGCAFLDYDNDGDLDVYLVQGGMLGEGKTPADAVFPPRQPLPLSDRLYRNDLVVSPSGERRLRFTDVTEEAGLRAYGYGFGVATGDYDNDGWVDLYVTNLGPNQMWRNQGDGTFRDVTAETGTDDSRWSVPAVFFDYDRDGWLDLYVGSYVDFTFANHKVCRTATGAQDYCGPNAYAGVTGRLFRNRGDGTFEDVSSRTGVARQVGKALGVVAADLDGDRWLDLYVANDGIENHMWMNQHDGTFRDQALLAGSAVNRDGLPEASMGVDAGDFDGDGDEDLFMTHLVGETNTLYSNDGSGSFEDVTIATGLAVPSWSHTSWGTLFFDYDNDGWLDLLVANGAVRVVEELARRGDPFPFHEPNQLFHNRGDGTFIEVSGRAGPSFALSEVTRGAAFGDVDNDGDTDVLLLNNSGPPRLLLNQIGHRRHWLGLRLLDAAGRDALGTRVAVLRGQEPALVRRVRSEGSFASAHDPRVLIGLGDAARVERVRAYWTSGRIEEWRDLAVDRYHLLREGTGGAWSPTASPP
ncbi:MAG TPA: CRTAC1 family protein [Thermoanaerobaculia bacterium]|nr:CRTAC1 family protein [Thermoanaerobaculia bacterium]